MMIKNFLFSSLALTLAGCGSPTIEIDESQYEPKIVLNGLIYPGQAVRNIKVDRNFPLGQPILKDQIALSQAQVRLTDIEADMEYDLEFNSTYESYEYDNNDLQIVYGKSYRLDVTATVDGKSLQASSTTTVPEQGLEIDVLNSILGDMYYRQKNTNGDLVEPMVLFNQSQQAWFYSLSTTALDTGLVNFITSNPFGVDINKVIKEGGSVEDFMFRSRWKRPDNENQDQASFDLSWFSFWFYGTYRMILYAGDRNFYHYYATHKNVMGMDGNLHEPIFDIEGEGIGFFGSAITDTAYINVLKP